MSDLSLGNINSKDELVSKLRAIIDQLTDFIQVSEKMINSDDKEDSFKIFSEMLNEIKKIPEELKHSPVLIEETIEFVEGIIGEVREIREQIEGSFSNEGMLKNAVQTLDKIPDSTFKATDQILNTIDKIMEKEAEESQIIESLMEKTDKLSPEDLANIKRLQEIFNENQNDHFQIMDALQFQDITTQQIQHVNDLLEKTEMRLSQLALKLRGLDEDRISEIINRARKKDRIYDPNASFDRKEDEQKFADELYSEPKKEELNQDDIENLFSQFDS